MKVEVTMLDKNTKVQVKSPRPGERGVWIIQGWVASSGITDPAYDVTHEKTGRRRIFRRSRMRVKRD